MVCVFSLIKPDQTRAVASMVESGVRASVHVLALYTGHTSILLSYGVDIKDYGISLVIENNNINTRNYLPEQINGWNQAF